MSFKLEQVRRDLIANVKSEVFWDLVHVCGEKIDAKQKEAMSRGVLIAEKDPLEFVASLMAAMHRKVPIILGNHQWGHSEWTLLYQEFSPAVSFGIEPRVVESRPVFRKKDQAIILIPTGGTSSDALRFTIHRWESLEAQSYMVQSFLGATAINSICCLPLFHVSGLMQVIRAIATQGQVMFSQLGNLKSVSEIIAIEDYCLSLVPTQLDRLFASGMIFKKLGKLKAIFLGGASANEALLKKARESELPLVLSYGMTETAGMVCAQNTEDFASGKISSGEPLSGVEIKINSIDGLDVIHLYSSSLFYGYWGSPLFKRDDAFCTNDYGSFLKEGQLVIEGRIDDWIISGGEKIDPSEVEDSLLATDYIQSALVLGKDSKEWGQALVAILVAQSDFSQKELIDLLKVHLSKNLAVFKRPKAYIFVEELPILENGKRDKRRLRGLLESVTV